MYGNTMCMCGPAFNVLLEFALTDACVNIQAIITCVYYFSRTTLRSGNGQVLSPEDIVMAGALDNPSGLDFSAATYPVSNLVLVYNALNRGRCKKI